MNRPLAVTLASSMVSVAAAASLMAEPVGVLHGPTCDDRWIVVASGSCPSDLVQACKDEVGQQCGFSAEYTTCQAGGSGGYTIFCVHAS